MEVREHKCSDWFTNAGVARKRREIYAKGVPNVQDWRFFTLTTMHMDGEELEEYQEGKEKMRRFLASLKNLLGVDLPRWAWKMEFHKDGFVHWHMLFEYKRRLTFQQMRMIRKLWGLGRVDVKRARDIEYLMKYATKAVDIPDWFQDHTGIKLVTVDGETVPKPDTFAGVRFWQTSRGDARFYTGQPSEPPPKKEPLSCRLPWTLRETISRRQRKVVLVAKDHGGKYQKARVVVADDITSLRGAIASGVLHGDACPVLDGFEVRHGILDKHIPKEQWLQIRPLHQRNPQMMFRARKLLPPLSPF